MPSSPLSVRLALYADSPDPSQRLHCLELLASSPERQRGALYESRRDVAGAAWPAPVRLGRGYSRATVARMARHRGLALVSPA